MNYGDPKEMRRRIAPVLTVRDWLRVETLLVALETRIQYEAKHPSDHRRFITIGTRRMLRETRRRAVMAIGKARLLNNG